MSKISLSPDASGTGIFTIASPNSNTNRTLTLPDDTGTIVTNSGNQAGSFTTLNTSGQVVFNDAGADVDFRVEGDTDANLLFVDASADAVGIGTSAPSGKLDVSWGDIALTLGADSGASSTRTNNANKTARIGAVHYTNAEEPTALLVASNSSTANTLLFGGGTGSFNAATAIQFYTAANNTTTTGTTRMTIDSSGNVGIGTSSPSYKLTVAGNGYFVTQSGAGDPALTVFKNSAAASTDQAFIVRNGNAGGTTSFQVLANGNAQNTNNSYGAISDVKLKQDIVDAGSQWDDIKGLRVRKYHLKNDPDGFMQIGLVAQEAEEVSPGLIDESPDFEEVEVPVLDDEGNPVLNEDGTPQVTKERNALGTTTKAIKYSVLYMKAVKALQEAMERIETLEASNTALEARIAALETGA